MSWLRQSFVARIGSQKIAEIRFGTGRDERARNDGTEVIVHQGGCARGVTSLQRLDEPRCSDTAHSEEWGRP